MLSEATRVKSLNLAALEAQIGNTPLLRLRNVTRELPVGIEVLVKAEHLNPGGSVKDRPALRMIREGEQNGRLYPGKTILDATSGNTGIAYAMIGAVLRYPVTLCLPKNASIERKQILRIYGAEIVETDPLEGSDGAQTIARQMAAREPEKYFYPDQYNNEGNWRAHYDGTGREIWEQTNGRVTHFVSGLGTCGTFVGVTRRLKELNPSIRCISLQPDAAFHGLEGWKHMQTAIRPAIYDETLADESLEVGTEDAYRMVKRIAREEGLLVSPSSAAALLGSFQVAKGIAPDQHAVIVTVFADSASKYLTERFWDEG